MFLRSIANEHTWRGYTISSLVLKNETMLNLVVKHVQSDNLSTQMGSGFLP